MKKIAFFLMVLVFAFTFTLSSWDNNTPEIVTSSQVAVNDIGKYAVNFLNSLDDGKYEVVSISQDTGFYIIFL